VPNSLKSANYRGKSHAMRVTLKLGDITREQSDAIVNAAN